MIILSIMSTVVDNPVVLVAPNTVQDYVIRAPVRPKMWCSQQVAGAFIAFVGIGVGITMGVLFGVYYKTC